MQSSVLVHEVERMRYSLSLSVGVGDFRSSAHIRGTSIFPHRRDMKSFSLLELYS